MIVVSLGRWKLSATALALIFLPVPTLLVAVLTSFAIAVLPEGSARPLTSAEWTLSEGVGRLASNEIPAHNNFSRASIRNGGGGGVFRSWSPQRGPSAGEATSPWFRPPAYVAVPVTGQLHPSDGSISLLMRCADHDRTITIADGNANTNLTDASFAIPGSWCRTEARVEFVSHSKSDVAGVGIPHEISSLSELKTSWIGLLAYLVVSLLVFASVALGSAAWARRWFGDVPALPAGLAALGLLATAIFYLYNLPLVSFGWIAVAAGPLMCVLAHAFCRKEFVETARTLVHYGLVWLIGSLAMFSIVQMTDAGVGPWNVNARFLPATWSSDNELPWKFAEALRQMTNVNTVFDGPWSASDRPPLMTGFHLIMAEPFAAMQSGNDGNHVAPLAFNTLAIVLSTLWMPVAAYVWRERLRISPQLSLLALIAVSAIPFFMFNSVYGWPKMLGGAFALCGVVMALPEREPGGDDVVQRALLFGALGAFGILSHMSMALFIGVAALAFLYMELWRNWRALVLGAVVGAAPLAAWTAFQVFAIPTNNPLTKYAFAGTFGFEAPTRSVLDAILDAYRDLGFTGWIDRKAEIIQTLFGPTEHYSFAFGGDAKIDVTASPVDSLRVYDFYYLVPGNAPLLVALLIGLASLIYWRRGTETKLAVWLTLTGLATLLAIWASFLSQMYLHHLPYGAVLAIAVGGVGAAALLSPLAVWLMTALSCLYASVVWIIGSLHYGPHPDYLAMTAFAAIIMFVGAAATYFGASPAGEAGLTSNVTTARPSVRPS